MTIENYFVSQDFYDTLKPLAKYLEKDPEHGYLLIEYIIDIAIMYSVFYRDGNHLTTSGLSQFLQKVSNKIANANLDDIKNIDRNHQLQDDIAHLFVLDLLEKASLTEEVLDDPHYKEALCTYIIKSLKGQEYIYHAFNSAFLDSIKVHGINPHAKLTDQQEINMIDNIFKKYRINMIFGWQRLNCEASVSYSMDPSISYYYGINSPEWFAQFTGQGFAFNPSEDYDKSAFVKGNYNHAKENLLKVMERNHFTQQDQDTVIQFFDKQWNLYANHSPMLAIIPNPTGDDISNWLNDLLSDDFLTDNVDKMMSFCLSDGRIDGHSAQPIDTSQAFFVQLPRYFELVKRITSESSKQDEVSDELSSMNRKIEFFHENKNTIYHKSKR